MLLANHFLIGRVVSVDDKRRAEVEILNHGSIAYPILTNVPILNYRAAGFEITFPVTTNDRVMVLLSDTDISDMLIDGSNASREGEKFSLINAIALPFNFVTATETYSDSKSLELKHGSTVIRIQDDGEVIIDANTIRLGESASQGIRLADGSSSSKVLAE